MIDTNNVKQATAVPDPIHPELIVLLFQILPVIDWIPPSLSGRAEIIRRHARDKYRSSICVEKKVFLSRPHIDRIHPDIERHVPHNADPICICSILHFHPLAVKQILQEDLIVCLFSDRFRNFRFVFRPVFMFRLPVIPAESSVCFLKCTEQSVFLHPFLCSKRLILLCLVQSFFDKCLKCLPQIRFFPRPHLLILHPRTSCKL